MPIETLAGYQTIETLRQEVDDLLADRETVVLNVVGEPGVGKTTLNALILKDIDPSLLSIIRWGDVVHAYDPTAQFGQINSQTFDGITDFLGRRLAQVIEEYQGQPHLILNESPAVTRIEGRGNNRGYTALQQLARHSDQFKGLNYKDLWVGWGADDRTRERAKRTRGRLQVVTSMRGRRKILTYCGYDLSGVSDSDISGYATEGATPVAIGLIESEVNALIKLQARENPTDLPVPLEIVEEIERWPGVREEIVVGWHLPRLLLGKGNFGLNPDQVVIGSTRSDEARRPFSSYGSRNIFTDRAA